MRVILGCLITAVAVYVLASAIIPSWRRKMRWKGTRVRCGPIATAGFGIALGVGATFLLLENLVVEFQLALASLLIVAMALIVIGNIMDFGKTEGSQDQDS